MNAHHIVLGIADYGQSDQYFDSRKSGQGGLLLPTRFFAVNAVSGVGRAQSTVGVCALNL
jgi:hypothetical protein